MNNIATTKTRRLIAIMVGMLLLTFAVWGFSTNTALGSAVIDPAHPTNKAPVTDLTTSATFANPHAATTLVATTTYTTFMPLVARAFDIPDLSTTDSKKDGGSYSWTLNWSQSGGAVGSEYIIEESHDANFSSIKKSYTTTDTSYKITNGAGLENVFYYRVRINNSEAPYSNVVRVVSAYWNSFSNNNLGTWQLVKEDFDDTQNVLSITNEGYLKLHVQGRWDYMIASPLVPAPEPPYRIYTRVKFDGPGNLNTYGSVFGGDWNGTSCPTYNISGDYAWSTCFNHYYRNILLWNQGGNTMQSGFKRIYVHSAGKNSGDGETFFDYTTVAVSSTSANDWNEWTWEVYADGTIKILAGDKVRQIIHDPTYINEPYWGFWASTDEYPGSDPLFDYVLVEPID